MTATCRQITAENGKKYFAMVVDSPIPKPWYGRLLAQLKNAGPALAITTLGIAALVFLVYCTRKKQPSSLSNPDYPTRPTTSKKPQVPKPADSAPPQLVGDVAPVSKKSQVTFPTKTSFVMDHHMNGSWIGQDVLHSFSTKIQVTPGTFISIAQDDFYLAFRVEGFTDIQFLPSPLFEGKKENDIVQFTDFSTKTQYCLQLTTGKGEFQDHFAKVKTFSKTLIPGSGNHTYRVKGAAPAGSLNLNDMALSPAACRWDFEKNALVKLTSSDCKDFVRLTHYGYNADGKSKGYVSERSLKATSDTESQIEVKRSPIFNNVRAILIVDIGFCALAIEFSKEMGFSKETGIETYSQYLTLNFSKFIDVSTFQVDFSDKNVMKFSYKLLPDLQLSEPIQEILAVSSVSEVASASNRPTPTRLLTENLLNGSWIGQDILGFSKSIAVNGTLLIIAQDDFYLNFQIDEHSELLPSCLFEGKMEGDVVQFTNLQTGKQYNLRLDTGKGELFQDHFAKLKISSQKLKPGTGNYTYRLQGSAPVGSLSINGMALSHEARFWDFEKNELVELTSSDCRNFELLTCAKTEYGFLATLETESQMGLIRSPGFDKYKVMLIVDIGVTYLAIEFSKESDEPLDKYTQYITTKLPKSIDVKTVQVDFSDPKVIKLSYQLANA